MSTVRDNLMNEAGYAPYCGGCLTFVRTRFNGEQFEASCCDWVSDFPADFIQAYRIKWNIIEEK